MPPVGVIGSACALGRNHGCAQRMLRRALFSECWAIVRLLYPPQHQAADANRGLVGVDVCNTKKALGIVLPEFIAQFTSFQAGIEPVFSF